MSGIKLFLRLYVWFFVRHLVKHPMRTAIVLLGIALGAAVFTSVRISVHATLEAFTRSMDTIAGRADRIIVRPGGWIPETLISDIIKHPGVLAASPFLTTYTREKNKDSIPFLLVGLDPLLDRPFRKWSTSVQAPGASDWLTLLKKPDVLMVSQKLARRNNWSRGDRVELVHTHGSAVFSIENLLTPDGLAVADGGLIAVADIASFQEFTGRIGQLDRIDLLLATPGAEADIARLTEQIVSQLPAGAVLAHPSERKRSGQGLIGAYQLNLSILSLASLFVGMFLVYSLIALNAASRREELAVIRSLGASEKLLFYLFLMEGAVLGIFGWMLAVPASTVMVKYLLQGISHTVATLFVRVRVDQLALSGWEIGLSFTVTVVIAVLGAFQPARSVMRISPKEVISSRYHRHPSPGNTKAYAAAGLVSILTAWPLAHIPAFRGVPLGGYLAILLIFAGFALIAPLGLQYAGNWTSPLMRRTSGVPIFLAGRQIRSSGIQTAVSVGALITAVALFVALVIMIHSFRKTVELWVNQSVSGDLFVSAKLGPANGFKDPMPAEVVNAIQRLDASVDVVAERQFALVYRNFPYRFQALELATFFRYGDFIWMNEPQAADRERLLRGEGVVISEVFANKTGLSKGDLFVTRIQTAEIRLPVMGIIRDYRTDGGVVFYPMDQFRQRYFDPGWSGARIYFRERTEGHPEAVTALRRRLVERCGDRIEMVDGRRLRAEVLRIFDDTFAVSTVLLVIALIIATLGITATLAVLVLERRRQFNTMIAFGATRQHIRTVIFSEAALMVLAGELAGLVCGLLLSHLLVFVINLQSFGWTFMYRIDWRSLWLSLPMIIATAVLAALPAIQLVFRQPPASVLRQ